MSESEAAVGATSAAPHPPDVAAALRPLVDGGQLAGIAALAWRRGREIDLQTLGWRDLERRIPMTRDTLFRAASMTKPITSALVMMLVEDGALALDDPITRWAPEFADMRVLRTPQSSLDDTVPAERDITVEDLLTHRAGLAYDFSCTGPIADAYRALRPSATLPPISFPMSHDAFMATLGGLPLVHQPGERFLYSHATDVLGFLAERVVGRSFRDLLIDRVFEPLGMGDTDFWAPPEKRDRLAVLYRFDAEADRLVSVEAPEPDRPPTFQGGGGGLITSLDDYLKFARMLLGDGALGSVRLLKPETVRLMRTNRLTDRQREDSFLGLPLWVGAGFGLGLSVVLDPARNVLGVGEVGAFGWPGAYGTWWLADPTHESILIYLVQHQIVLSPDSGAAVAGGKDVAGRFALPAYQQLMYGAFNATDAEVVAGSMA